MSLLQAAISCQPISSLKQKESKGTMIKYKVIFWIYKAYFLRLSYSLMPQTVCYVEIYLLLFTIKQEAIKKKMQVPKPYS